MIILTVHLAPTKVGESDSVLTVDRSAWSEKRTNIGDRRSVIGRESRLPSGTGSADIGLSEYLRVRRTEKTIAKTVRTADVDVT